MNSNVALSIVVPIYNEEESLPFLVNQLLEVLQPMEETFELVLVNDGSTDASAEVLKTMSTKVPELVCVLLRKNYGSSSSRVGIVLLTPRAASAMLIGRS